MVFHFSNRRYAFISASFQFRYEAAHLVPHARKGDTSFKNGLLLHADLHKLFDIGEMATHLATLEVHFYAVTLEDNAELHSKKLNFARCLQH
ncbi:TPA: HNH endonuclease [Serratia fonticola]